MTSGLSQLISSVLSFWLHGCQKARKWVGGATGTFFVDTDSKKSMSEGESKA